MAPENFENNENNADNRESEKKKQPFWTKGKVAIVLGLACVVLFTISYFNGFTKTKIGLYTFLGSGVAAVFLALVLFNVKQVIILRSVKDPNYYWTKIKEYYAHPDPPRLAMQLTWKLEYLYYPAGANPQLLFYNCYDILMHKNFIVMVKPLENGNMLLCGQLNVTWEEFLEKQIYKLIMQGILSSKSGTVTMIKDGEPMTIPSEVLPYFMGKKLG